MRGIYQITIRRPVGSVLVYVGSANVIEKRQREHLLALQRGIHRNKHLQNAYDKYGLPEDGWLSVLELVPGDDRNELIRAEQRWFDRRVEELGRKNVMNIMRPALSPLHDPEVLERHRERTSETMRRLWQDPNFSEVHKDRLRRLNTIPELIEASRERLRRKRRDPEFVARLKAAQEAALAKRYIVTTPDGQELEVFNLAAFCRENGLNQGNMAKVARGVYAHHKGWRVRYADEEESGAEE